MANATVKKPLIFGDPESIARVRAMEVFAEFNKLAPCKNRACAKSGVVCEGEGKQHGAFWKFKEKHPNFDSRETGK